MEFTLVLVWVSMCRRSKARWSSTEMVGSAWGTIAGLASNQADTAAPIGQEGGDLTSSVSRADNGHGRRQGGQGS